MTKRDLDQRVDGFTANRLRMAGIKLKKIRVDSRASRIYINEIVEAIEHGMLLTVAELGATLLEIWIRDLLVMRRMAQTTYKNKVELKYALTKIDRDIEGLKNGDGFTKMCKELLVLKEISQDELDWLGQFYINVRTPLHHGITGRLIDPDGNVTDLLANAESKEEMFLASVFGSAPHARADEFEDYVYRTATKTLEEIVDFLAAHQVRELAHALNRLPK